MKKHKLNHYPAANADDYRELVESIKKGYDEQFPVVLYEGDVLDGWNRQRACDELGIKPAYKDFVGTPMEAFNYVIRTNKRRNLSEEQLGFIAVDSREILEALQREARDRQVEAGTANLMKGDKSPVVQNSAQLGKENAEDNKTRTKLAEAFGTTRHYVSQAANIKNEDPALFERLKAGEITMKEVKNKPHVSNNSGENEWYTPEYLIESARLVLGNIDLDPASSELANKTVKAGMYYTKEKSGIDKNWFGNVWLNPPYAQPLISQFSQAVINKRKGYKQAIILVNNATETNWLQEMIRISDCICLLKSRVKFIDMDGKASGAPLQGQIVLYIGNNKDGFINEFKKHGICLSVEK